MPGVDDGAASVEESRSGIKAMLAAGVTGIITTPHVSASLLNRGVLDRHLEKIEIGWEALQELVASEFPKLKITRGAEVMLDVPHPILDNPFLRLGGTKFVLFEFPFMNIPPNSTYAIREMCEAGWIPILAHPERYANMEPNVALLKQWKEAGAYMQINAGSILGQYGSRAKSLAWSFLESGDADYMCSDYHSRGKCLFGAAVAELRSRKGGAQADALVLNAKRITRGELPDKVESFSPEPQSAWDRVFRRRG